MNTDTAKNWAQRQKERGNSRLQLKKGKSRSLFGRFDKRIYAMVAVVALTLPLVTLGAYFYQRHASQTASGLAGNIINVGEGGDFQAALNQSKAGDTIILQAGAKYVGSFTLPNKTGREFITIQSSELANLPGENQRVSPLDATRMPKILSSGKDAPAILTAAGAHHYRFVGIEVSVSKPEDDVFKLIYIGDDQQKTTAQVPQHIVFDRSYIHAHLQQTGRVRSGLSINGSHIEILNSYISDFHLPNDEGHAIVAWNAPGPFLIVNNYIEAAGINVLFGGATAQRKMNPADLEFRRNHVTKKLEWRGSQLVKNLFELKDMRRAVVEENIFEHNWASAQDGAAIVLTPASLQSGADARVEDVIFRLNILRKTANGITMTGTDYGDPKYPNIPVQNRGVKIENNLFAEIGGSWSDGNAGRFMLLTSGAGPDNLTVNHNTIISSGSLLVLDGGLSKNFVFTNNIGFHNEYGIISVGNRPGGIGTAALKGYMTQFVFKKNVIVGADAARYPPENFYPANVSDVKFINYNTGNYRLDNSSVFRGKATDGKDIGCDFAAILEMEKKVLAGNNNL